MTFCYYCGGVLPKHTVLTCPGLAEQRRRSSGEDCTKASKELQEAPKLASRCYVCGHSPHLVHCPKRTLNAAPVEKKPVKVVLELEVEDAQILRDGLEYTRRNYVQFGIKPPPGHEGFDVDFCARMILLFNERLPRANGGFG